MKKEHMLNRIMAVILAAVIALPVSAFAADEVSPEAELQAEPAAPASELATDDESLETEDPDIATESIDSLVNGLEPKIGRDKDERYFAYIHGSGTWRCVRFCNSCT